MPSSYHLEYSLSIIDVEIECIGDEQCNPGVSRSDLTKRGWDYVCDNAKCVERKEPGKK